jgi:hypothetical protein
MVGNLESNPADWSWLENTYWYVLPENLSALQFDAQENTLAWVVDQTVWNITGYRNGYFWGISSVLVEDEIGQIPAHGSGSKPVFFSMLGSITPEGQVHLTFIPAKASRLQSPVIGIGRAIEYRGRVSLEMQMSSGSSKQTAHWAYMCQVAPDDPAWESLPGVKISVPQMLDGSEPPQLSGPTV